MKKLNDELVAEFVRLLQGDPAALEQRKAEQQADTRAREEADRLKAEAEVRREARRRRTILGAPADHLGPHVARRRSRHKRDPADIDRELAQERVKRMTRRTPSRHAPPAPVPAPEPRKPWSAAEAFSIVGERAHKRSADPRARPGEGRRGAAFDRWAEEEARRQRRRNGEEAADV